MDAELAALPDDVDALKAALLAARAETAVALAEQSSNRALIAHLKLQIEKLNRDRFGPRSERTARLLDQMELQLEELETAATEDELAAETAAAKTTTVAGFTRVRPARRPFPEHLPRERVVVPGPVACACCGSARLSKLGEDVTESLETIPRTWKVIQHVREKFSCRDCERISQPPAPFHVIPRGWAGPNLLAMILFEKFGQHQPLNRQAERYAREGVPLSLSTLADQVGACTAVLMPLFQRLQAHVMAAERLHGDDTTVPVLARGKTDIARLWTYLWTVPAPQGFSHRSGDRRCSYLSGLMASLPRALMRSADRRPITLASAKLDRSNGLRRPRSDRLPSLCRMPSQTNRAPVLHRNPVFLTARHNRPSDPSGFIGKRDGRDVEGTSTEQLRDPGIFHLMNANTMNGRSGAMDQQLPDVAVATLANPAQPLLAAG
jgi:transposase